MRPAQPIAVVSAVQEELRAVLPLLQGRQEVVVGHRRFHSGSLLGQPVVLVLCGIGKVAAATTATLLLDRFDVRALVFTGVAGGLAPGVAVGDVVVADSLLQHDMDASPLFPRFEIPLTGRSRIDGDKTLSDAIAAAAARCLSRTWSGSGDAEAAAAGSRHRHDFGIVQARLHRGLVVSGDRFVSSEAERAALRAVLPDALAVEMEGAALAQVCADFDRPFAVLRTISDRADDSAHVDFGRFIVEVASEYTVAILSDWLGAAQAPG